MENMHMMWVFVMDSLHNSMINDIIKLKSLTLKSNRNIHTWNSKW
jgi:hypothetical protein